MKSNNIAMGVRASLATISDDTIHWDFSPMAQSLNTVHCKVGLFKIKEAPFSVFIIKKIQTK
jgi:hypothetical protein